MKHLANYAMVSLLSISLNVYAQTDRDVEDRDPGRIDLKDLKSEDPQIQRRDRVIVQPSKDGKATHEHAKSIKFKLKKIVIENSTVFSDAELIKPVENKIGAEINLLDLNEISQSMTSTYRKNGYIISQVVISRYDTNSGVVVFTALEGSVDKVYITGDKIPGGDELVKKFANKIAASKPLRMSDLERYMLIANDIPGIEVKTLFSPSPTKVGATDLTFIVKHKALDAMAMYDNRVNKIYGPQQYTGMGIINESFIGGQTTLIGRKSSQDSRLLLFSVDHNQMVGTEGVTVGLNYSYVKTKPKFTEDAFNSLNILGVSNRVAVELNYPLLKKLYKTLNIYGKFDSNNSSSLSDFSAVEFQDKIRSLRVGADYQFSDKWYGTNKFTGEISQGLNILGATTDDNGPIARSRADAKSNYTKVNVQATRIQYLPKHFSVLFSAEGQYSLSNLLSSEQFGFGGSKFGSGYASSIIVGEHGLAGKIEPRYTMSFENKKMINMVQMFVFYDVGSVWHKNPNQRADGIRQSASSLGYGARIVATKYLSGSIEMAKPLTRSDNDDSKAWRVFFNVKMSI